jgi:hypothetical protein
LENHCSCTSPDPTPGQLRAHGQQCRGQPVRRDRWHSPKGRGTLRLPDFGSCGQWQPGAGLIPDFHEPLPANLIDGTCGARFNED